MLKKKECLAICDADYNKSVLAFFGVFYKTYQISLQTPFYYCVVDIQSLPVFPSVYGTMHKQISTQSNPRNTSKETMRALVARLRFFHILCSS